MAQIPVPPAPNLPNAPDKYDRLQSETLTRVLRLYFNKLTNVLQQLLLGFNNYGTFYDTQSHTITTPLTGEALPFDSSAESYGITVEGTPPTKLTVTKGGVYNFQFSSQLDNTGGGTVIFWFWFKVNGVSIANSATKIVVSGPNDEAVAAWNYLLTLNAGDYFELAWTADSTDAVILAEAASGDIPAIPSTIMTVTYVCPNDAG